MPPRNVRGYYAVADEDLFTWCKARPAWQQEAIRQLATKGNLDDEQRQELIKAIRIEAKLINEVAPTWPALSKVHLKTNAVDAPVTVFGSIGPLKNIDRLAADQSPLKFGLDGITLIFGVNGSGKSGYCRIAKKVCHCLHNVSLRGNVYEPGTTKPKEVNLSFRVAGDPTTHSVVWTDDAEPPPELARISVFDSEAANLYVDSERNIEFLPADLSLLTSFGEVLRDFGKIFEEEEKALQKQIKKPLPSGYQPKTTVSNAIERLRLDSQLPTEDELRKLGAWTEENEAELATLIAAANNDPALLIKLAESTKQSIDATVREAAEIIALIGDEGIAKLRSNRRQASEMRKAAEVVATGLLAGSKLPISNSETWRQMLVYARQFAAEAAPDAASPQIATTDVCVLCQQHLDTSAVERLAKFDEYVAGKANKDADEAKTTFLQTAQAILKLKVSKPDEIKDQLANFASASTAGDALTDQIASLFAALQARLGIVQKAINENLDGALDNLPGYQPAVIEALGIESVTHATQIEVLKAMASEDLQYKTRIEQIVEIEARKKFANDLEVFIVRRSELEELAKIKVCGAACSTGPVTSKLTQQRRKSLTPSLQLNFEQEVKAFDLTHLPLKISDRGEVGQSKVQIGLETFQKIKSNSDILSEGEKRALGLAGFLAEAKELGSHHGIIIDDPVSSLDHSRAEAVAKRLVAEAKSGRQVIIFTHNLFFHYAIWALALEHEVKLREEWITKHPDGRFGIIDESKKPWVTLKVGQRIAEIDKILAAKKNSYSENDEANRSFVSDVYTRLRSTWEHTVEEILFANVITRFRPEVSTQRLRAACVEQADYKELRAGMTQCSKFSGHDSSQETPPDLPKFDNIKKDMDTLRKFVAKVDDRRKQLEKDNLELEKAPRAAETV